MSVLVHQLLLVAKSEPSSETESWEASLYKTQSPLTPQLLWRFLFYCLVLQKINSREQVELQ